MLRIDRWVGVPLCFLATRILALLVRSASPQTAVRRILFVKLAEQGSTVLAYQALGDAVRRVGRENVYMMVFEDNRFILDLLDVIPRENVLALRSDTLLRLVGTALAALRRLRALRVDAAIDLEFFARSSALLVAASGAPTRVGLHAYFGEGPYRGNLMTHPIRYNPHLHTSQLFALLVSALDFPVDRLPQLDAVPEHSAPPPPVFARASGRLPKCARSLPATSPLPPSHR